MTDGVAERTVRVTLQGPSGRHDLVVSPDAPAADLVVPVVVALLGDALQSDPALLTRSGAVLDPRRGVADQGVEDGDVLVVVPTRTRSRTRTRRHPVATGRSSAGSPAAGSRGAWVVWLVGALCLLVALAVLAGSAGLDGPAGAGRAWLLVVVAGSAVGAVLAPATPRGDAARVLLPLLGGLGVLVLLDGGPGAGGVDPGRRLVAMVAACVVAAVLVSAARATDRGPDEPLLVLLVVAVLTGTLLLVVVMTGASPTVVWALVVGGVLPVLRLLPAAVVDVPDTLLLELDRLSVTAWTAREGRRDRVRTRLRAADVTGVVGRGRWLHASAAVGACAVAVAGSALLLAGGERGGLADVGVAVLVPTTALGLVLLSRTVRGRVPKVAMLVAAGLCAAAAAVALLTSGQLPGGGSGVVTACAAVLVGFTTACVGAAFGAGWRSVRWGRFADVLEALCVVVAMPAALLAAGVVEGLRAAVA